MEILLVIALLGFFLLVFGSISVELRDKDEDNKRGIK